MTRIYLAGSGGIKCNLNMLLRNTKPKCQYHEKPLSKENLI